MTLYERSWTLSMYTRYIRHVFIIIIMFRVKSKHAAQQKPWRHYETAVVFEFQMIIFCDVTFDNFYFRFSISTEN